MRIGPVHAQRPLAPDQESSRNAPSGEEEERPDQNEDAPSSSDPPVEGTHDEVEEGFSREVFHLLQEGRFKEAEALHQRISYHEQQSRDEAARSRQAALLRDVVTRLRSRSTTLVAEQSLSPEVVEVLGEQVFQLEQVVRTVCRRLPEAGARSVRKAVVDELQTGMKRFYLTAFEVLLPDTPVPDGIRPPEGDPVSIEPEESEDVLAEGAQQGEGEDEEGAARSTAPAQGVLHFMEATRRDFLGVLEHMQGWTEGTKKAGEAGSRKRRSPYDQLATRYKKQQSQDDSDGPRSMDIRL